MHLNTILLFSKRNLNPEIHCCLKSLTHAYISQRISKMPYHNTKELLGKANCFTHRTNQNKHKERNITPITDTTQLREKGKQRSTVHTSSSSSSYIALSFLSFFSFAEERKRKCHMRLMSVWANTMISEKNQSTRLDMQISLIKMLCSLKSPSPPGKTLTATIHKKMCSCAEDYA